MAETFYYCLHHAGCFQRSPKHTGKFGSAGLSNVITAVKGPYKTARLSPHGWPIVLWGVMDF
ncbi:hypothetical protein THAOC_34508, partial [Thalassiosira oceanica]